MAKMPTYPAEGVLQKEVNYRKAEAPAQACGVCGNFIPPSNCAQVAGNISPEMTCDLWTPMESAPPAGMDAGSLDAMLFGGK